MKEETLTLDLTGLEHFCEDVSLRVKVGDIICLFGELGSGKTTFARNLINSIYKRNELEKPLFIKRNHKRISSLHVKDRQAGKSANVTGSDNQVWGYGDTPIIEVLQLMRDNSYKFTATIELEYRIPEGSNRIKEVIKCYDYCKQALIS